MRTRLRPVFLNFHAPPQHVKVFECPLNSEYPISTKISTFREKASYFEIIFKKPFFAHISENIEIQEKITLFLDLFEKNCFCPYVPKKSYIRKYQHIDKFYIF